MFRRGWYHFTSLIAIIAFMSMGYSATLSVLYAMALAVALSFLSREHALTPLRFIRTLGRRVGAGIGHRGDLRQRRHHRRLHHADGAGAEILDIAIQAAGGLADHHRDLHGADRLGGGPRRTGDGVLHHLRGGRRARADEAGVPDYAAHMFVFYYAVLSEVSPPTALSPFAAAAITGAGPYRTTLMAWKYTLPAFVLPFVFVTDPEGVGLLLNFAPGMTWVDVVWQTILATLGLAALASACQGYAITAMATWERWLMALAGVLMVFPAILVAATGDRLPVPHWIGIGLAAAVLVLQMTRRRGLSAA
jgi:TRAP-type uncharacterized transport system fused permease subunit